MVRTQQSKTLQLFGKPLAFAICAHPAMDAATAAFRLCVDFGFCPRRYLADSGGPVAAAQAHPAA
jgi:hypothetical protein